MTSKLKSETARTNGAKSKGPVTQEGKAKSSQNARKHGVYAGSLVLDTESQEAFDDLVGDYVNEYQPAGPSELDIVKRMVEATWRRNQAETCRTAALNLTMVEQSAELAETFPEIDNPTRTTLAVHHLYGERLTALERAIDVCHRQFGRALADLIKLRKFKATQLTTPTAPPQPEPKPDPTPEPEPEPTPQPHPGPQPQAHTNEPTTPITTAPESSQPIATPRPPSAQTPQAPSRTTSK